ncbi:hypothetical protein [Gemmata sp. SH-PL17]|uniref:hypothetical protein n=1 Tax=Gemmata sp. SH-PL17 TaxID=1630693 RepID=UPI001951093C|nr:hypothetical protein [Gemmata sp. SH-PL17]
MSRLFFVVAIALFGASSAHAGFVTGLYNTGIDTNGNLANDRTSDPHYTLIRSADGSISVPQSAVVADTTKFPFVTDGWLASGTLSKWIAPISNQSVGNSIGDYVYRTSFQIVGGDPTGIRITGIWTADNYGKDIVINGHSTGISYRAPGDYTFKAFQSFVLPSDYFVNGTNTLDFVVNNSDNGNGKTPTGLRVELVATTIAPEPSSWVLAVCGLAALGLYRRPRFLVGG